MSDIRLTNLYEYFSDAFIKWTKKPSWVEEENPGFFDLTEKNLKTFQGNDDIDMTLVDMQAGFSANTSQYAGGIGKGQGFTMSHNEYSGSPVRYGYSFWVSGVRDPNTGIATYPGRFGMEYAAANHTGELVYIVTRPDANNTSKTILEYSSYYTNVMPTRIPLSHLNYTSGTQEAPQVEVPFAADRFVGQGVDEFAADIIESGRLYKFDSVIAPSL